MFSLKTKDKIHNSDRRLNTDVYQITCYNCPLTYVGGTL